MAVYRQILGASASASCGAGAPHHPRPALQPRHGPTPRRFGCGAREPPSPPPPSRKRSKHRRRATVGNQRNSSRQRRQGRSAPDSQGSDGLHELRMLLPQRLSLAGGRSDRHKARPATRLSLYSSLHLPVSGSEPLESATCSSSFVNRPSPATGYGRYPHFQGLGIDLSKSVSRRSFRYP